MSSQQAWRLQQARRGTGTVERVGPSAPGPIRREGAGAGMPEHRVSAPSLVVVACDGHRSRVDGGLSMPELADVMPELGAAS